MRWGVVVCFAGLAHADGIRVRHLEAPPAEPLLHLDPTRAEAEGGLVERQTTLIEVGPRARLATETQWWKTGLAPSMFEPDLVTSGWRAAAELSYDLGPFSVGVNASLTHDGATSHRAVGLFAFRTFRLSRWTKLWIILGLSYEQLEGATTASGASAGLRIGGTFR